MNVLAASTGISPRKTTRFTEADWRNVLAHLGAVIGAEADRYVHVPAAKLVAAIPFLADSEDPDRFAVSNLLTFHGATKARTLFDHRDTDNVDVMRRLATFHVGKKADKKVVSYGLTVLALISLGDHEHDAEADRKANKPNPLDSGAWDATKLRKKLEARLKRAPATGKLFGYLGTYAANWWST